MCFSQVYLCQIKSGCSFERLFREVLEYHTWGVGPLQQTHPEELRQPQRILPVHVRPEQRASELTRITLLRRDSPLQITQVPHPHINKT